MKEKIYEIKEYMCTVHTFDGPVIRGKINTTHMERLSDLFTKDQSPFVVIYNATVGDDTKNKTLILNKSGIFWVEPDEPEKPMEKQK